MKWCQLIDFFGVHLYFINFLWPTSSEDLAVQISTFQFSKPSGENVVGVAFEPCHQVINGQLMDHPSHEQVGLLPFAQVLQIFLQFPQNGFLEGIQISVEFVILIKFPMKALSKYSFQLTLGILFSNLI